MSDLVKRHRAAADALRHQLGNASAAQCKFHDDTADELERLRDALERIERVVLGTPDQFKQIATEALRDE